ncbi:hypothetical protein BJ138DRAFT_1130079 [Hygrophoropsis aurantiaca]|uniref:Uncharacterized protein n=1 Tax=Hygrophoropsis aurantiaca TaxID=72124 RepID=A0ACB7ZZH0_9AGAM|nr:hypothetical protein BJ138DRAFT_1130079 [Hygrophoropsis aurantiaca]
MGSSRHYDNIICATIKVLEHEVLELEKQEGDLIARLRLLQDSIVRKRVRTKNLKNSLVSVNRLPNEILLMFFRHAVQDWVNTNDAEEAPERSIMTCDANEFIPPCTPAFALSHVSHHWRQLAITTPSLWTNLVITQNFERHMDIFRDFLRRANGMPISVDFYAFPFTQPPLSRASMLLMEAILLLTRSQKINALTSLSSPSVISYLISRIVQPTTINQSNPPLTALSCLTTLGLLDFYHQSESEGGFTFRSIKRLLSSTPQLKTLQLELRKTITDADTADKTTITLPMLENLTLICANHAICELLPSLYAPNVRVLKLLEWDEWDFAGGDVTELLFVNSGSDSGLSLMVPRFPLVQDLTLWVDNGCDLMTTCFIRAFPRVTHLIVRSPTQTLFSDETNGLSSPATPTFQYLQHVTFDFNCEVSEHVDFQDEFTWLRRLEGQLGRPLLISVFDRSTKPSNSVLFPYYEALQRYGTFDASSSRLEEFLRWQALDDLNGGGASCDGVLQ